MWFVISVSKMIREIYPSMTMQGKLHGNNTMSVFLTWSFLGIQNPESRINNSKTVVDPVQGLWLCSTWRALVGNEEVGSRGMDCSTCSVDAQNAKSWVRVNNSFSDEFGVKGGVHQGSVLSPLLFLIVLEALSLVFRTGCPWEPLYAEDLVLIAESEDEHRVKLKLWKSEVEAKGLRVNMEKTKVMFSGSNLHSLKDAGKYPCGVCRAGVGVNSIFCTGCSHWVHWKCSE